MGRLEGGEDDDLSRLLGDFDGKSFVGLCVRGILDGTFVGAEVVGKAKSIIRSGHEDAGPIAGFKNRHEQSVMEPSLVGTSTLAPDCAQTKELALPSSSSTCPDGEKAQ